MTPEFDTDPMRDEHAERIVLSAMMNSADVADDMIAGLNESHFPAAHGAAFRALKALREAGAPTEPHAVRAWLDARGELQQILGGTGKFVIDIFEAAPVPQNAYHYAPILVDWASRRGLDAAATRLRRLARTGDIGTEERIGLAADALAEHTDVSDQLADTAPTLAAALPGYLDRLEDKTPDQTLPTGWTDLDRLLGGGLRPGQLVVVGARPGMGKSVFMLNAAYHAAVTLRVPALFASLEMSRTELMDRIVSHAANVDLTALRERNLTEDQWGRVARSIDRLGDVEHLVLDDDPGVGLTGIRARLRKMRRSGDPARLLVVDYLQLMQSEGRRADNRVAEVSQLSRALKLLAKEFDIPVVVGAQLNREVEKRTDKRPILADLRESGSIEQDADIVIMLHREDAYDKEAPRAGEADFIVAKHRNGPTSTVTAAFQGHHSRFMDMATDR
ncbi:replicative DNA helicase [Actinocorallia sp. API 0066]|uniref:replicative DNA helicase n=1 Tax=Actinocorallia sp. API 0066 TaxID=2896846 RepID=UPI001E52527E|nr:replicative DNA helicase [Actinocorallia sp. API 0066]MCD0450787.1 replicative DNA helicase [Actinocorallia sp. API 0066]